MNKNHWVEFVRAEFPRESEGLNNDVLYADFKDFVNLITEFYQTGKIKDRDWDIPEDK
jgi:hypothetical protein